MRQFCIGALYVRMLADNSGSAWIVWEQWTILNTVTFIDLVGP